MTLARRALLAFAIALATALAIAAAAVFDANSRPQSFDTHHRD